MPTDFLWLNDWTVISWTSREIMIQAFLKTIQRYRDIITQVLAIYFELTWEKQDIIWSDIITKSDTELITELKLAREAGLISQYTWIKLYLGYNDDTQIQDELLKINSTIVWNI